MGKVLRKTEILSKGEVEVKRFYSNAKGELYDSLTDLGKSIGKRVKSVANAVALGYDVIEAEDREKASEIAQKAADLLEEFESKKQMNLEEGLKDKKSKVVINKKDERKPLNVEFQSSFSNLEDFSKYVKSLSIAQRVVWIKSLGMSYTPTGKENIDKMATTKKLKSRFFPSTKGNNRVTPWAKFTLVELKTAAAAAKIDYMKVNHEGIQIMRLIEALMKNGVPVPEK